MITLVQFFEKRLKDDKKDLFNLNKKESNLQDCVNYVFEYFNTYINSDESQKLQIENDEKLKKYYGINFIANIKAFYGKHQKHLI